MKAECTWGDGPDVLVSLEGTGFVLHEGPKNPLPPRGAYTHGYVEEGSICLSVDEAEMLAWKLISAAAEARRLEETYREYVKEYITKERWRQWVSAINSM